jgi:hypothetical protein
MLTADQVSSREVSSRSLILYGTPRSNPILAKMLKRFGWNLEKNGIALGERAFSGEGLVLIACQPHPENPRQVVTVYAAGQDKDLVGINNLFHGPTDWIVARRDAQGQFHEVAKGDFPRDSQGRWLPLPREESERAPQD